MPEVFADTSPIQYLHLVGHLHLLPALYHRVVLPQGVVTELEVGKSLGIPLPSTNDLAWIEIRRLEGDRALRFSPNLGLGEKEVLALALEARDPLIVLDDALARRYAKLFRLRCTGTLGVLLKAKEAGLLERVLPLVDRLQALGFRLNAETRQAALELANEAP